MNTEHSVYHEFSAFLAIFLGWAPRPLQKRITFFVFGILATRSVVLKQIAAEQELFTVGRVSKVGHEKRLRRCLDDPRISWHNAYKPFLSKMIPFEELDRVVLIVDEVARKNDFRVLVAALCCAGRAVPVAWETWRAQQKKTINYWTHLERLLAKVKLILRRKVHVTVVADRAFGNTQFSDVVQSYGWDWLARLQKQTCFEFCQGAYKQLQSLVTGYGRFRQHGRLFKKAGWREATVEVYWKRGFKEPLLLGSSLPSRCNLVELYRKRFWIECMFRDWKSKGFQWESSQVNEFHHHKRLVLFMAMATVLALNMGEDEGRRILSQPSRELTSRPIEAKSSLFQMGLQRMRACLLKTQKLPEIRAFDNLGSESWSEQVCQHHLSIVAIAKKKNVA